MPSSASGLRLAAATAAGSGTPDATRLRTAAVQRDDRPGKRRRPGKGGAVSDDLHIEAAEPPAPVAHAGECDRIADEEQSVRRLQPRDQRPQRGMDVDTVGDELDVRRVVEQGGHGNAGRSVVDAGHRVEEVGRGRPPGVVSGTRLVEGRRRVTDRDRDAAIMEPADQVGRACQLGGDRDHAEPVDEPLEHLARGVGRDLEVGGIVRTAPAGGEERALQVESRAAPPRRRVQPAATPGRSRRRRRARRVARSRPSAGTR